MTSFLRNFRLGIGRDEDRRSNSLSESDGSFSRHSSIQGPHREGIDTSFPVYCTVKTQFRTPGVYARSILSLGNGVGIHHIEGDIARPKFHLNQGACIGDVGYMNENGGFYYCFNVLYPSDHPIQRKEVPPNFSPIQPPLSPEEVRTVSNHFTSGTVMATEGIEVSRISDSPLKVEFVTSAREGAILILPTGATREELIDPSRIYPYVKEHAASWYQWLNGDSGEIAETPISNGTLWVITGVDRVDSWAMATFPAQKIVGMNAEKQTRFKYNEENSNSAWEGDSQSRPLWYDAGRFSDGVLGAVLLSVLSVALNPSQWSRHVAYIPPKCVRNCPVLPAPSLGLQARLQEALARIMGTIKPPSRDDPEGYFHPSIILLHILLLTDPSAVVGIVADSVWCSQLNGRLWTHPEVIQLVRRVIDNFDVVNTDGIATFTPKKPSENGLIAAPSRQRRGLTSTFARIFPWVGKRPDEKPNAPVLQNMCKVLWIPE
ncbi:hypothetical protein BDZ97DRAFT_2070445 [Flammula alnicola]|nr:hypothetical protein BDZ97DRAFT_2070445 [Flammula alnicola]